MLDFLRKVDNIILNWINVRLRNKTFDKIMPIITSIGNLGIVWIIISVLLLLRKNNYKVLGQMIIISLIITTIIGEGIIKNIVKRKRPFYGDDDKKILITRPITYSFPSGHTASSFAVATVFIKTDNAASLGIVLLANLIAFSRVYLGVHYPSDVIGGGIIGTICGFITFILFF